MNLALVWITLPASMFVISACGCGETVLLRDSNYSQLQAGQDRPSKTDVVRAAFESPSVIYSFDEVWEVVASVPRSKGEFETTSAFQRRQTAALEGIPDTFVIEAPIDLEYVKYDADKEVLSVITYAMTNTSVTSDELSSAMGMFSELEEKGVSVPYGILGNIAWTFPRERRAVGTYTASNALGASMEVIEQEGTTRVLFDREGGVRESVWKATEGPDGPVAFSVNLPADKARGYKQDGLEARILFRPYSPYHATGIDKFRPTTIAPFDRTIHVKVLFGDIQAAALTDRSGKILDIQMTN